jgi:hypothetical protein
MWPTWVGIVTALSLAIIALSALTVAVAGLQAGFAARRLLRSVEHLAGPAVGDVRQLVGTIKTEADALVGASRDIRHRIVKAADAAEARLGDLDALVALVQGEVEETALDAAVALQRVRRGFSLLEWGRSLLRRRRRRRR